MLEIKNVRKTYDYNWSKPALDNISITFPPGEIVGLFGENGAGKTTLFKCILRFTSYGGEITLDGHLIDHKNIAGIAYGSSDNTFFPHLSIKEHKDFYMLNFPLFNESRFDLLTEFFELPLHKKIADMSQGQKNQVETILALSQGAAYILLDEPFSNNDIFKREDFYKVLLGLIQPQESIILASHLIDELKNFISRVVLLRKGEILADKKTDELDQEGSGLLPWIKQLYGYEDRAAQIIEKIEREMI